MPAQPIVVGGTYDWFLNPAMINTEAAPGVFGPWDLTSATVTISFMFFGNGPDAPPTVGGMHFGASVVSGPAGTARYINAVGLLNQAGTWGYTWKVVNGGTVLETGTFFFEVEASGAAT